MQRITITNLQYEPLVVLANSKPEDHPWCRSCWYAQLTSPSCSRQSCKTFLDIRGSSSTGLFWMPCPGCASCSSTLSIQSTKSRFEFESQQWKLHCVVIIFSLSNEFLFLFSVSKARLKHSQKHLLFYEHNYSQNITFNNESSIVLWSWLELLFFLPNEFSSSYTKSSRYFYLNFLYLCQY